MDKFYPALAVLALIAGVLYLLRLGRAASSAEQDGEEPTDFDEVERLEEEFFSETWDQPEPWQQ